MSEFLIAGSTGGTLEELYRSVIHQIPDGIYLVEPESKRLLLTNRAMQTLLGYTEEEMRTLTLYDFVAHEPESINSNIRRVLEGGRMVIGERQFRHKDGSLIDVEVSINRFHYGDRSALCAIVRDVTERKRMTAQLQSTTSELRGVVNAFPDLYCIFDAEGTFLNVHAGRREDLIRPAAELLGRPVVEVMPSPHGQRILEGIRTTLATEAMVSLELALPLPQGEQIFEMRMVALGGGRVIAVSRNITERRRRDMELKHSQRNYETLINSIDGIVWSADPKTMRYHFVSRQAERILGYPVEQWYREDSFWYNHTHPEDRDRTLAYSKRCVADRRDHRILYRMVAADGRVAWIDDFVSVILENGEVVRLMGVLMDVTERKRADEELERVQNHLRMVVDNAPVILFALDDRGSVSLAKGMGLQTLNLSPTDLIGQPMFDLYADDPEVSGLLRQAYRGEAIAGAITIKHGPGAGKTFDIRSTSVMGANGRVGNVIGIAIDITHRQQVEHGLRQLEERLHTVLSSAPIILFATDASGVVVLSEGRGLEALGLKAGQLVGSSAFDIYRDDPEILGNLRRVLGGETFSGTVEVRIGHGAGMSLESHLVPVMGADGRVNGMIGVCTDVTEHKRLETKVRHISYHDALTGLPNFALFKDRLAQAVTLAQRAQQVLSVLLLDLDRFKLVNDTLGHQVGERLLIQIAQRLKTVVGPTDTLARMGGDEFVILSPGIEHAGDAARMAQRVLEAIKPPFQVDGHELHASMSIGVALFPDDGEDPQTLLKNADTAMYHAKETGRSNYHFYSPAMNAKAFEKLALENSLRRALEHHEFILHYQPQVDIRSGRMIGMEALARWKHPDLGLVPPGRFIPLAEDTGVIVPLGEWILHQACRQNKLWQDEGLPPVRVAVNLSARQFQQPDLADMVKRALKDTGLEPRYLELEITESIAMKDPDFTSKVLHEFKRAGVEISIDDFGVGYSSLSSLKYFPLDALKIDRSFIQDLNTDANDAAIATALIALGHRLNMRVIAEGVETEDQLQTLLALDCDMMQGHYFCRPLAAEDLRQLLARGARLYGGNNDPSLF